MDNKFKFEEEFDEDAVCLKILEKIPCSRELPARIWLFQALPKSDKMEWIIEKAVELGVYAVVPVVTRRCVVRLDEKKAAAKVKRWNAISESAAKQSKRMQIPHVHEVMPYRDALVMAKDFQAVCIPYEEARGMQPLREYLGKVERGTQAGFFIGPEGGFEPEEIRMAQDLGIMPVSLGKRILRTETAGIALMSAVMLQLEQS